MITDANNVIVCVNKSLTNMVGYDQHELVGHKPNILSSGSHKQSFYRHLWIKLHRDGHWVGDITDKRKDGSLIITQTAITVIYEPDTKQVKNYVVTVRDITCIKQYEQELHELAFSDTLTGLYNRRIFYQFLEEHIAIQKRTGVGYAVAMIDLDDFSAVNSNHGHNGGDVVLKHVADCMINVFRRDQDIVARLGGDEFVILLTGIEPGVDIIELCTKICDPFISSLTTPIKYLGAEICVTASVGVVFGTDDISTTEEIIKRADEAMYLTKRAGKNAYSIYNK
jgi:diguanylate cyclase (GGDEF)-like protein/PAS domain S-box-containing protein